ncbi:hypothetical protein [Mucilaginibacter paludis]|uniref:Uncharacterized protein n=1 Tax=Mucilaginibacter paludis DSM 18603 TaxID=714943 RepID=H1Y3M9_9SPHI|nr:hypothetical protein [Mucilaginibacter paludis]EHQ30291.1 hypothetical protein Mucpa_6235 [Mucilaginibacter paludis DSM 18603]
MKTPANYNPDIDPIDDEDQTTDEELAGNEEEQYTEDEDDLREIRTSDDVDEPDPEDPDLVPLESGDPDTLEDE